MTPPTLADLTPSQLDADIRAAAIEVFARAQTWRNSPTWCGEHADRRGYTDVVLAIADIDTLPEPADYRGLWRLTRAVIPIISHRWPDEPGPAHALSEAVDRLRHTAVTRLREAERARLDSGR
jgi:hypothetical protein